MSFAFGFLIKKTLFQSIRILIPQKKPWLWVLASFLVVNGIFFVIDPASATVFTSILKIIGWPFYVLIKLLATLLGLLIGLMVIVAKYNGFVSATPVMLGWAIVRDVANMFFIIIMLIIAFSTIVGIQSYNYKSLLAKTLLMAVLVNFSKSIAGVLIDISQVFMMTFVFAFQDIAVGNFTQALGLDRIFSFSNPENIGKADPMDFLASLILGFIVTAVSFVVVLVFVVLFAQRIVMLWFYLVLSPLPWVLSLLPFSRKYSDQWWSGFGQYVTIGPILAFFLWLSLMTLQATNQNAGSMISKQQTANEVQNTIPDQPELSVAPTGVGTSDFILSYIITIGMLLVSLMMAAKIGGLAGKFAGAAMNKIQDKAQEWSGVKAGREVYQKMKEDKKGKRERKATERASGLLKRVGGVGIGLQDFGGKIKRKFPTPLLKEAKSAEDKAAGFKKLAQNENDPKKRDSLLAEAKKFEGRAKLWRAGSTVVSAGKYIVPGANVPFLFIKGLKVGAGKMAEQKARGEGMVMSLITNHRKNLEGENDQKVKTNMKDMSLSPIQRMAAILEAASRGILDRNEAAEAKDLIANLGGGEKVDRAFNHSIRDKFPDLSLMRGGQAVLDPEAIKTLGNSIKQGIIDASKIRAEAYDSDSISGRTLAAAVGEMAEDDDFNKIMAHEEKRGHFQKAVSKYLAQDFGPIDPTVDDYVARKKITTRHLQSGGSVEIAFGNLSDPLNTGGQKLLEDIIGEGGSRRNIGLNISNEQLQSNPQVLDSIVKNIKISELQTMRQKASIDNHHKNLGTIIQEIRDQSGGTDIIPGSPIDLQMRSLLEAIKANPRLATYLNG